MASKGDKELERLVEAWLQLAGWRTHRAAAVNRYRPGGSARSAMHDLFGCFDLVAFRASSPGGNADGFPDVWFLQTTTPTNRSARRTKVAAGGPYPPSVRVTVLCHESERVGRGKIDRFALEDYLGGPWGEQLWFRVDMGALREHRSEMAAEKSRKVVEKALKKAKKQADKTCGVSLPAFPRIKCQRMSGHDGQHEAGGDVPEDRRPF